MSSTIKLGAWLSIISILSSVALVAGSSAPLTVSTSSGTVQGFINDTNPDVRQFLGVPFARPPVADLRWLPPQPLANTSRNSFFNATQQPLACPQFNVADSVEPSLYSLDVPEFQDNGPQGEDCLRLSVWAPSDVEESLPVIIWIYGGTFLHGGISIPYQQPTQWVQRTKSHIVVAVSYRVGILGFPTAKGLDDQNLGLLDQRAGIEWVQANIAQFGGDPDRITLWGQSAGGASVDIQNFAFYDDPIVNGFISDSGTVFLALRNSNFTFFDIVAEHFNCSITDAQAELACMRNVPSADIEAFLKSYADNSESPELDFYPYPDDKIVFTNYTERYLEGKISDRPIITGSNKEDGIPFVDYPNPPNSSPNETEAAEVDIYYFRCPAAYTSTLRAELNLTTYRYWYEGNFSNISPRWWMGAYHQSEVPMIMGTYGNYRGAPTPFQIQVANYLQDQWVAFANDPSAGVVAKGWTSYATGYIEGIGETFANESGVVSYQIPYLDLDGECADYYYVFADNLLYD